MLPFYIYLVNVPIRFISLWYWSSYWSLLQTTSRYFSEECGLQPSPPIPASQQFNRTSFLVLTCRVHQLELSAGIQKANLWLKLPISLSFLPLVFFLSYFCLLNHFLRCGCHSHSPFQPAREKPVVALSGPSGEGAPMVLWRRESRS